MCAELSEYRPSTPDDEAPPPEPLLVFHVVGKGPKTWGLPHDLVDELQASYPGVDVFAECRAALSWCRSNPERRKTARGMPRFLDAWMRRVQERGGARASPNGAPVRNEPKGRAGIREFIARGGLDGE